MWVLDRALLVGRWVLVALLLSAAAPALAHVHLRASQPADGDTLQTPLEEIRLEFSGAVVEQYTSLTLIGPDGRPIAIGDVETVPDTRRREFVVPIDRRLPGGEYTVHWRTMAGDGHIMEGSFSFILDLDEEDVSLPAEEAPDLEPHEEVEIAPATLDSAGPVASGVRFLHYLALLLLLGCTAFHYGVVGRMRRDQRVSDLTEAARRRNIKVVAAALGLLVVVIIARLWAQSAQLHGIGEALELQNISTMLSLTTWGHGWLLQVAGAVVVLVGFMMARRSGYETAGWAVIAMGTVVVAVVPALSGHAAAVEDVTALAVAIHSLHVLGAGVWLGTLAVLLAVGLPIAIGSESGRRMASVAATVSLFSPVALAGIAVAAVTGVANALFQLGAVTELWTTNYGMALLIKVGVLIFAMGLGLYHWRIVLPGLAEKESPARFRRTAAAELIVGILVLLATAFLAGLPTPG